MKIVIHTSYSKHIPDKHNFHTFQAFDIATHIVDILQRCINISVILTDPYKQNPPSMEHTKKVDCFISIDASTIELHDNTLKIAIHPSHSSQSHNLASNIKKRLVAATGFLDYEILNKEFPRLHNSTVPTSFIHLTFGTNTHDTYSKTCAEAIANGLIDTFHLQKNCSSQPSTTQGFYRIQVGPFMSKSHAKTLATQLSDKGYSPYIIYEKL
ncbi:MAG: SPOR domain-containing protein [Bacillus sp. (in: firmicutes)]